MDERMRFIAKLLDGESMSRLCEEFGISRKTGYKIWNRYQNTGAYALVDRSRKPHRYGNQLPEQVERTLVRLKREKPYWGAPKIRALLIRRFPNVRPPAVSTVHAVLDRNGLVNCRKRRRFKAEGTRLSSSQNPNDLWSADFKGEFMLGDKRYCYPLTVSDHASRYLLAIEALDSVKERGAFPVFERTFQELGLPEAIRTADSWDRERRMVAKVEVSERGFNRRFVVTNRQDLTAGQLYDHYIGRGQCENFVKAFKKDLAMDRLSCHRFLANQFRLFIHALAYVLILRLRDYLCGTPWHNLEIETLRRRINSTDSPVPGFGNFSDLCPFASPRLCPNGLFGAELRGSTGSTSRL